MGWEYQTLQFDFTGEAFFSNGGLFNAPKFNQALNRMGWEGWELVNTFDTNRDRGQTKFIVAVFKRALTPDRKAEMLQASKA